MISFKRRTTLGVLALSIGMALSAAPAWAENTVIKISHQFPGGTVDKGDFRDRLVRMFAAEVEKRTKGSVKFEIYPGSSLMKTNAQFSAMRKGALDMSLVPLSYAGGEVPETNIGLMPGLVTSYEQSAAWKNAAVGKELTRILADKGVVMVSWIWQAGGMASRGKAIVEPEDAKGMKVRGGSREMDLILKEAGAAVVTLPSNEIYAGMQTGAMDAALTSSTSLISFRLEEVSKALTTGRGKSYWFMLEPLMMSKAAFDRLGKDQQAVIMQVGAEMEAFALKEAKADDEEVAKVFAKAGAKTVDLTEATVKKWQDIARRTAWKDFAAKNANTAKLLQLAEQVK
jgi:TRAP-type C4-dicarboxylate transport system substrate-binding protein